MANRSYTTRQDFRDGWNIAVNRYARPGAIGEMVNAMLDPLAHGALRPAYGVDIFASTGTINEYSASDAAGRYPGICHISRLKEADYGNYDEITVGVMRTVGTITSAHFYLLAPPDTSTIKMNFPWGNTMATTMTRGLAMLVYPYDWCWIPNEQNAHDNITMTLSGASNAIVTSITDGGLRIEAPAIGVSETISLVFTHNDTAEVNTISFRLNYTAATGSLPNIWMLPQSNWYNNELFLGTYSYADSAAGHDRIVGYPTTAASTVGADSMGRFMYMGGGGTIAPFIASQSPLGTQSEKITDNFFNASSTFSQICNTVSGTWTGIMHVYGVPGRKPASAAMKHIWTASNVVQAETTPYGIWKSAGMNGFSYFYDGISTPFRLREDDPFEASTTYSKTVGMDRPTPNVAVSNTASSTASENNVEGVVRYFIAYLDDELDEGPLSPYFPNYTGGIYSATVTEANKAQGWDAGTGTRVQVVLSGTPATVSKVRFYRTMKDRGSPYFVADIDYATPTITLMDTLSDLDLGDLPFTHGDPPPTTFFSPVVYYDRIWGLGTRQGVADSKRTYLFWTDVNAPESFFWDGNYAAVYAEDGDEATALVRDRSGLIIFKNNHTYRMVGRNPEDITFVEVTVEDSDTGIGCPHPNAAIATDKGTFFYWNGAVYLYTDGGAVDISKAISPLLKGNEKGFSVFPTYNWPNSRGVDANSVDLSFDPKHNRLFFSYEYIYPLGYPYENKVGQTLIFDASNGIWVGQLDAPFNFIRRYKVPVVNYWDVNVQTLGWGDTLLGGVRTRRDKRALFPYDHEGVESPCQVLRFGTEIVGETNIPRDEASVKFRPIIGNLGPFISKRFLWIDYLADSIRPKNFAATGDVVSTLYLDGGTTGDTDTLSITSGHIYADRLRHVSGDVGAEVEPKVDFKQTTRHHEVIRLFEYAATWQNLGKDRANNFTSQQGLSSAPM